MTRGIDKREFIKLAGITVGSLASLSGNESQPMAPVMIDQDPAKVPKDDKSIPELVDIDKPLPYSTDDFSKDTFGVLPEDWYQQPVTRMSQTRYDVEAHLNHTGMRLKWEEYGYENTPRMENVPLEIRNTSPWHALKPDSIPSLVEIKNSLDHPSFRFEKLLQTISPLAHADAYPRSDIASGQYGPRAADLWARNERSVAVLLASIKTMKDVYGDLIGETNSRAEITDEMRKAAEPRYDEIKKEFDRLQSVYDEVDDNFSVPLITELTARTSVKRYIPEPSLFPNVKEEDRIDGIIKDRLCFAWTTDIINTLGWMNNDPNMSPVVVNNKGQYEVKPLKSHGKTDNEQFNIKNFFEWMEWESESAGWVRIVNGDSYDKLLDTTKKTNSFIVALQYGGNNSTGITPWHSYIMRPLSRNFFDPDRLVLAELLGGPPDGRLYYPIDPEGDEGKFKRDDYTLTLFLHKY